MSGFVVAAPSSGSGKTTFTLGLLRALINRGIGVSPGKIGPDYIDPAFHCAASGTICYNFDPWAMQPELLFAQANEARLDGKIFVLEAMMGLFDGAADGSSSAADLASMLGLPVILVIICEKMSHSIAAIVHGFQNFRSDIEIAGVVLNQVGSARHEAMLRQALAVTSIPIIGCIFRDIDLELPERHLGLVQAVENQNLDQFISAAANIIDRQIDFDALIKIASQAKIGGVVENYKKLAPLGQRIAVAKDVAFSFCYPHLLKNWQKAGAEISLFSPLANEGPNEDCDAVYLPGGYPELHAAQLAGADRFRAGMHRAIGNDKLVFGECGGYMALGEGLIDKNGQRHEMLGALPLVTNFQNRKRHLGYRHLTPIGNTPWKYGLKGHEFHYSTIEFQGEAEHLFEARDALGTLLGKIGQIRGNVMGSYMHIIDRE